MTSENYLHLRVWFRRDCVSARLPSRVGKSRVDKSRASDDEREPKRETRDRARGIALLKLYGGGSNAEKMQMSLAGVYTRVCRSSRRRYYLRDV